MAITVLSVLYYELTPVQIVRWRRHTKNSTDRQTDTPVKNTIPLQKL